MCDPIHPTHIWIVDMIQSRGNSSSHHWLMAGCLNFGLSVWCELPYIM